MILKNRLTPIFGRRLQRQIKTRVPLMITLRVLLAILFALPAFIFSDVVPDVPPFHRSIIRLAITTWFALLGYGVFPDLASVISNWVLHLTNQLTDRLSNEIMSQIMRAQRQIPSLGPVGTQSPIIGGVSVNAPLILDTSAIIDGRVLDIAKTGFLFGTILIPNFVLTELQQVADSTDFLKRSRGRKGFELVEELKKTKGIRIDIWEADVAAKAVDDKIIKLAKSLHGKILTTDYNLNRVASLSNAQVLNINDLANALKTIAVPGENMSIKLVHLGKDPKQGVGYLSDGTMIVVEDGAEEIGKDVSIEVTRMLQSSAGRMIFGKLEKSPNKGGK